MFCLSECSLVFLPGDEQQCCKFLPRTSSEVSLLITGFFYSRPVILGEGGRRKMTCSNSPVIYCYRKNWLKEFSLSLSEHTVFWFWQTKNSYSVYLVSLAAVFMMIGGGGSKFQKYCTAVTVNCISVLGFGSRWSHWASPVGKELLVEILCVCGVWDWVFIIHFLVKSWMVFTTLTVFDVN